MKKSFVIMASALAMAACGPKQQVATVPAIDLANLDTTVSPAVDFYQYSTGGWQKNNPLKPEFARFGSFDQLRENNVKRLNDLFAQMGTLKAAKGSVEQKISDLYKQGLDSTRLNAEGAAPLKKYVDEIYAAADKDALVKIIAGLHNVSESSFFGAYVMSDLADSDNQILYLGQGGLGIGDRDYYVEAENAAIKEGYRNFLAKVFSLTGVAEPEKAAANALAVEDVLATNSWTSVQERDIQAQYNPCSTEELIKNYPGFDWKLYFETRGIADQQKLIVSEPSFFKAFCEYFGGADLAVLKDYVAGQLIQGATGSLSDDFYTASFDFFSTQMSGIKEQKPRWKRAMQAPNGILGEAVGKMYVAKYFPESSKTKMLDLVDNLKKAFSQHIDELDWMSDSTKTKAHEKLDNFTVKIGYPDKWKDYSTLDIDPQKSYYENLRAAGAWYTADNMSKLGKPTDKTEWGMSPQTVNAYYNPTTNEICFPAAILQPPFYNPDADDAVNYGAIGVVIGHEMTHGFDDQGRQFDKNGNLTDWWAPGDAERFEARAKVMEDFFNNIEVLPGLKGNGALTLGENLADHGGLMVSYTAFQNAMKEKPLQTEDGFTPEQRFFLAYANLWAGNIRDEEIRVRTKSDPHSLGRWRVDGALPHIDAWYEAFGITEKDSMFVPKEKRVTIW